MTEQEIRHRRFIRRRVLRVSSMPQVAEMISAGIEATSCNDALREAERAIVH
jgi:hypothetical protein